MTNPLSIKAIGKMASPTAMEEYSIKTSPFIRAYSFKAIPILLLIQIIIKMLSISSKMLPIIQVSSNMLSSQDEDS